MVIFPCNPSAWRTKFLIPKNSDSAIIKNVVPFVKFVPGKSLINCTCFICAHSSCDLDYNVIIFVFSRKLYKTGFYVRLTNQAKENCFIFM